MVQAFDLCIRGAGIVGSALALLLAREQLRVALVPGPDPQDAAGADVRAYALNRASAELLQSLRCWPDAGQATAVRRMQVLGDQGGGVHFDAATQAVDALAWIVDVPALQTRLAEALRFQPQVEVVAAPVSAALTVVCEGRSSSTRAEFGVDFERTPYAQHAIATRLHCTHPHGQVARQWFLPHGILAFLPLDGPLGHSVAVVWSVAQELVAPLLALAPEAFAQELQSASRSALGALTLCAPRAAWPLQLARAHRWCGAGPAQARNPRGWVLAGDAAHTVHPLTGQGLNLGLGDARALAHALRQRDGWRSVADPRLLRRYERERKAALFAVALASDGLQQLFSRPQGLWQAVRNGAMAGFERSGPLKKFVARQAMAWH
ncbi:FAD-dependent monooxygenase [Verminephrobacter aporrectodeae]|uniref:FAD-dependent monooxygenase n=1 Tax=Verminephrobacter aporrectodeae TaxID=1110389 RepID=UPI0022449D58|nr:FAD-dependent monooxygenase [Verminephrobacter aporrectodeae]MCW8175447.1 ubiquinone biosynthesis protein UbiH [Verminephrobacter aporrectodeae subsp. tuberculatae]MCW8201334.1 ubiquinone biosynthesis protein UbiH [Verminephrobacter aporrectodeae subsp. tuberculatae]